MQICGLYKVHVVLLTTTRLFNRKDGGKAVANTEAGAVASVVLFNVTITQAAR